MSIKGMSLRAQLNGVIISVLALSFIGSVWINIINSQHFLNGQLTVHAQDTATSLGLSLSEPLFNNEAIIVESNINAIFDRGFYQHIILESIHGDVVYQRINNNQPEHVPDWFVRLFTLVAPEQTTMIDTGWTVGGILKVKSHTGMAYAELWNSANDITHATLFIFLFALLLAYLLLQKMYRSINAISLQAAAIQKRQFVLIEPLPDTKELRNFVIAMNAMVTNIKNTFDELTQSVTETHKVAYIDQQTGVENRRAFIGAMGALLAESSNHSGYIMMARIEGLAELNKIHGYTAGDSIIEQLIGQITAASKKNREIKLYRVSGSEFCLCIENDRQHVQEFMLHLFEQVSKTIEFSQQARVVFGLIKFSSDDLFSEIMSRLDMVTNIASESREGFFLEQSNLSEGEGSKNNLKAILDAVLTNPEAHIKLNSQRALKCSERLSFDQEVFATFEFQNERVNTGDLFSIASQFKITGELDFSIIKILLSHYHCNNLKNVKTAVNLSRLTLSDSSSMIKIITLIKSSEHGGMLVIGIPESAILENVEERKQQIDQLKHLGCAICINRFGTSIESLQYLLKIRPEQVKLSPAFTRSIGQKDNNVQMVSAFVRMVHGLDITVIAHCVETEQELQVIQQLNIDTVLGYVIDKPTALQLLDNKLKLN